MKANYKATATEMPENVFKPLIKILIYVLDDENNFLKFIQLAFEEKGISNYVLFTRPEDFLREFNEDVQIAVLDVDLKAEMNGIDVMRKIRKLQPLCDCIFMSSKLTLDSVIDIVNEGGRTRFVRKDKPDFLDKLCQHVQEATIETDAKIRSVLQTAARIDGTIKLFEKFRKERYGERNS